MNGNLIAGLILNDSSDEVILDPRTIATHYVKSWFFLDLLSSMPLDYLFLLIDVDTHTANMGQLVHAGKTSFFLLLFAYFTKNFTRAIEIAYHL